jgi:hypothetical protein
LPLLVMLVMIAVLLPQYRWKQHDGATATP